jgi:hypothetical protein
MRENSGYATIITWDDTMTRDAKRTQDNDDGLHHLIQY